MILLSYSSRMMPFIHDDFLLTTKTARRLYHEFAAPEPIIDYHNHLPPKDLAENRQFRNLFEIWLEGDHYKWRAMRSNGVAERFCTGDAAPYEKFLAWAHTVPYTVRNPLYHWTHLELKRHFGINELLNEKTAPAIWKKTEKCLAQPQLSTLGILKKFRVQTLCTTDDPTDNLQYHQRLKTARVACRIYPCFRPDKVLHLQDPKNWNRWVDRLAEVSDVNITSLNDLEKALLRRHDYFHQMGCRMTDHGLEQCYANFNSRTKVAGIVRKARSGKATSPEDQSRFATHMLALFGQWNAAKNWTMQLHLGAMRNNNTRCYLNLGPDTGFDSMGDWPQARQLAAFLDHLDNHQALPKTILYNLNPADNYVFATILGNFQDGSIPGKMQWGSGWWFLDQKEGMEWQLNALSNLGLLSRFIGMLTDSRSFMSFPRHEYFRRILCNLLGREVEQGEIPKDFALLGTMIRGICHSNARRYLDFPA